MDVYLHNLMTDYIKTGFMLTHLSWQFCFWLRQHFGIKNLVVVENSENIMKDSSKLKLFLISLSSIDQQKKTKLLFFLQHQWILHFCDCSLLSLHQYAVEPKPTERKQMVLAWYILHLNEWCQACPIWWQVFIYCFTDNILHRVTLEV